MGDSDQSNLREAQGQLSEDEDTVEFEIEVVTSSASVSRASTPARDTETNPSTAALEVVQTSQDGNQKQQTGEPTEEQPQLSQGVQTIPAPSVSSNVDLDDGADMKVETNREEGVSAVTDYCHEQGVQIEFEIEPSVLIDVERASSYAGDECDETAEAPGAGEIRLSEGDVDISSPPSNTGEVEEKIPLGDPLRGQTEHEVNQDSNDSQAALVDSLGADYKQDDLMEAPQVVPQSCRQLEPDDDTVRPSELPEAPVKAQANDQESSVKCVRSEGIDDDDDEQQYANVCDAVKATSDSGDGYERFDLVDKRIQCPAGWSLVDAYISNGHFSRATTNERDPAATAAKLDRERGSARSSSELLTTDHSDEPGSVALIKADATVQVDTKERRADVSEPSIHTESTARAGRNGSPEPPQDASERSEPEALGRETALLEQSSDEVPRVEIRTGTFEEPPPATESATGDTAASAVPATTKLEADDDEFQAIADEATVAAAAITDIQQDDSLAIEQQAFDQLDRRRPSSSTSSHLDTNSDCNFFEDEDLEREFDEEPEFKRRDVKVKRNQNPRDEYELGDELGRGKFGTVFRCTELASGLKLAAKFIHMRRREDREDVEREVAIMSVLQHKRLLQLYDAFDDGLQEMCLITELVEGGELFERIVDDDFDLTEKKAAIFMRQICEGVEYMHSEQIVHLDMKPENILCLSRTGIRIKLIDFGLARRLDPQKPIRVLFGTPDFAAPEVLAYETVTLATDMWSVGVICYVLLSGLSPFMGDTDIETMANVMRATFDFNDQAFEAISDLAKDFISKLLVRDPGARLKPSECLKHAWLQRGGAPLEAHIRERRESSYSLVLGTQHRLALEQAAMLSALAATSIGPPGSAGPTPPTPPTAQLSSMSVTPSLFAGMRPRGSFGGESTTSTGHQSLDKRRLKRYVVRRKWHKTVHAIMALGRMGANLKSV